MACEWLVFRIVSLNLFQAAIARMDGWMILAVMLMMILMMILMMVGAGTCILSRLQDQGPGAGTNEHPRRAVDVMLSQSKAPIEIFISRWVPWPGSCLE